MRILAIFLIILSILSGCSNIERTKDALEESAQVYSEDAFNLCQLPKINPKECGAT